MLPTDKSTASTSDWGNLSAQAIAIQPLPVQISKIRLGGIKRFHQTFSSIKALIGERGIITLRSSI